METPLIYTSRGNVPIDSLRYEHEWVDTTQMLILHERWFAADGVLVKNNMHAYAFAPRSNDVTVGLQGVGIGSEQARM